VKLLLDGNLSDRIISRVVDLFPDSTHIKTVGLSEADDFVVLEWAKKYGLHKRFWEFCVANLGEVLKEFFNQSKH
jgi:hypothetical protein